MMTVFQQFFDSCKLRQKAKGIDKDVRGGIIKRDNWRSYDVYILRLRRQWNT